MTEESLDSLVKKWDLSAPPEIPDNPDELAPAPLYGALYRRLCWFGKHLWSNYLPAQHHSCNPSYSARLAEWIGNTKSEKERKLLLNYAGHITFLTRDDSTALYRAAFDGPVTRWVIDQIGLRLTDINFQTRLRGELHRHTWFCPVTDSMDINAFCHINHLTGIPHRPPFATEYALARSSTDESQKTAIIDRLRNFISSPEPQTNAPPLKRLVLLEDFVGSGTQSIKAIVWAAETLNIPVLFVPLIICPKGYKAFQTLPAKYPGKLFFKPLMSLHERDLLGPERGNVPSINIAKQIEAFAETSFERVAGGPHTNKRKAPYTPFGWEQTGCSLVTHSNTPNNTLPLVHHQPVDGQWKPLFPRSARD